MSPGARYSSIVPIWNLSSGAPNLDLIAPAPSLPSRSTPIHTPQIISIGRYPASTKPRWHASLDDRQWVAIPGASRRPIP
ncbi:MAG: hypothetical protein L0Z54_03485, partial [Thermoplasmata archaeon]|nr:hypothetical protein [Thermoplasmata archaeon]